MAEMVLPAEQKIDKDKEKNNSWDDVVSQLRDIVSSLGDKELESQLQAIIEDINQVERSARFSRVALVFNNEEKLDVFLSKTTGSTFQELKAEENNGKKVWETGSAYVTSNLGEVEFYISDSHYYSDEENTGLHIEISMKRITT